MTSTSHIAIRCLSPESPHIIRCLQQASLLLCIRAGPLYENHQWGSICNAARRSMGTAAYRVTLRIPLSCFGSYRSTIPLVSLLLCIRAGPLYENHQWGSICDAARRSMGAAAHRATLRTHQRMEPSSSLSTVRYTAMYTRRPAI